MTIIAYLIILTSFCNLISGDEVDLNVCVKFVPTGPNPPNNMKRRPSVPVQNCQDRDMACPEIFKFMPNNGVVLANNLKPFTMTIIAYLIILTSFCNLISGDEVDLNVCVKFVPTGPNPPNNMKRRPSVPVQNCQDRDMACPEIFKFAQDVGVRLANNLKPLVSEHYFRFYFHFNIDQL
ncbi:unnamed protein product [Dracunculus medinensis]|uniref:Uncharacterized protein n=1 Tax=Dracunculus medinensis TaxID=318479 RepID=A0A0N4US40_DRAME|nr:unnamed protein product [Dracunculus medinensis]